VNPQGVRLLVFLGLGAVQGAGYLSALAWNIDLYCRGSRPRFALLIHVLRFLGGGVAFVAIARMGAVPLLSALVGFHLMRILALRMKVLSAEAVS
jgi:N-ATPase, AtpR subunit